MDHGRAQELLHDYLDGELSADESRELELHLEGCDGCRAELEDIRETLSMLSGLKRLEPSPDFLQQVNQKLRRRTKSPLDFSFGLDRKIPFEAVSMVLLGILLALYLLLVVLPEEQVAPDPPPRRKPDAGAAPAGRAGEDPSTRIRGPDAGALPERFAPSGGGPSSVMRPGTIPRARPVGAAGGAMAPPVGGRRAAPGRTDPPASPSGGVEPTRSKGR